MWYEIDLISRWTFGEMIGDSVLNNLVGRRVFKGIAPPDTQYPLILTRLVTATDVQWTGPNRVKTDAVYSIHYITDSMDTTPLVPIASRVDELLNGKSHVHIDNDGSILSSNRVEVNERYEVQRGTIYWSYVSIYQISAQANTT